ncbi:hypothetical protein Ddye_022036 [Dipteronia dyeriana]|uniref:Uncharacterized protein n=1 Tax=Dipteronia dyeriana TaxID=168575 RepID=A0AAD9U2S9_9ROSI|nr:hypothetical protein Ddye_022036 [Dipteronia dyeriana]
MRSPPLRHETLVSEYLTGHYDEFFDVYEKLLTSPNYVTRQQSLKVFVANPNKPREVKVILARNHEKLLQLLRNLSAGKGADDEQFEEEKELIIAEIERVSRLPNLDS